MKSSEPRQRASSGTLHSVLAVYLPLSFLLAFVPFCANLIRGIAASPVSPPYGTLLVPAGLCALAASFYYSLMKISKADHTTATIRGAIIVILLTYPAASLLRFDKPLGVRFFPGLPNILASLCTLYIWVQVISLKRLFEAREVLESYTGTYRGEKLQQLMLEDADLLSSLDERILKTRRIFIAQILLLFLLGLTRSILKIPLSLPEFIMLVLVFLNGAFFFGLLGLFRQEHYHAGEGIAAEGRDRTRRIAGIALCSLAAMLGALILSPGRSILPPSLIFGFFAWLASLLARPPRPASPELPPLELPAMSQPMERMRMPFDDLEPTAPWPFWEWLRYGAIALVVLLFIRFMVSPLFDRSRAGGPLRERLCRLIMEWLKNLRSALTLLFNSFGREGVRFTPNAGAIRRVSGDLFAAYSLRKQREIRGSVTLFARLIVWGTETLGVSWEPVYGAGEYCALLKNAFLKSTPGEVQENSSPEKAEQGRAIIRCGELFEQALYARESLSASERREFKGLVETITAEGFHHPAS